MGQKKRMRIQKYEEKQKKSATHIITGIFIALIIIALAFSTVFCLNA